MNKRLLLFLMALLCFGLSSAQTVQTTNGTVTQTYIPLYSYYSYSYTQHIVLKSELENGGWDNTFDSITKLRWHWSGTGNLNNSTNWKVYLGNTSKTAFSSSTDWVALTNLTQVFDGNITIPSSAGWIEIELDQAFQYDGIDNLVIAVNELTPSYCTYPGAAFTSTSVGTSRGLYKYQDSSNPDLNNPPSGTTTANLPNVQIYFRESCPSPGNIHLTAVGSTTATVAWTAGYQETSWNLEYRELGDETWIPVTNLIDMSYELTNLTPNTQYQVRLQSDCGTEQSSFTFPFTFYTSLIPVQLPYFNDFENPVTHSDFQLLNGTQTNQWIISSATDVNNTEYGSYAMYISNDPTTDAWAYTNTTSRVYAFCDVEVPTDAAELKLTFDWIANGASATSDFLRVYWMPVNVEVLPGQIPPTVGGVNYDLQAQIGNYTGGGGSHWLSKQTTWQQAEFVINTTQFPDLAGNTWRLYFHWRNGTSSAMQPPATVDNISLQVVDCPTPSQLVASNPTTTSVDLAWTENGNAAIWNVEYKKLTEDTWTQETFVIDNPYTVQNLDPSTPYQFRVQSDCGTEVSPYTFPVTMATQCAAISTFPWEDSFESITAADQFPQCWLATGTSNKLRTDISDYGLYNRRARTGTDYAYFVYGCNNTLFTPEFQLQGGVSYDFSFWYVTDGYSGWQTLKANVYSAQSSDSLIQQIAEATTLNNQTYQRLKGTFTPTADGTYYFGVYCQSSTAPYYLTMDDFMVAESATCTEPTGLTATNITSTSADINFVPAQATDTEFKLTWRVADAPTWEEEVLYTTSFELTQLTPNTFYQVRVFTACSDGTYSDHAEVTFRTACSELTETDFPYTENFDTYGSGSGSFPTCWNYLTTYSSAPYCSSSYTVSSPYSLYAYSYPGLYTILIAPGVDENVELSDLQVTFYARGASGEQVHLGVIEDPTSAASFVLIQSFDVTNAQQQYTGYLSSYTGTGKHVALRVAPITNYTSYYFDNFVMDFAPDCLPVNDLTVSNVGATSALVSWTPNGTPDYFNIEVIAAGDPTGMQFNTSDNHYILTGLTELTNYTVSVTPECSGVEGLPVSKTFATTCALGGDVIVGTPGATTSTNGEYLPTYTYYNYCYTQQIFDATELSDISDSIFGIGFQYFIGTNYTRNLEIHLGHTLQTTYSSTSNYVPGTNFVKVFDGSVTFTNTGENNWFVFNFTTPFIYDSDSNLVVTVIDKSGNWEGYDQKFRTHATTGNKAIYLYDDNNQFTLAPSGGYGSAVAYRSNVKFVTPCQEATCYPPNVIVDNIGSTDADFQIIPYASETSWEVEYKPSEETDWIPFGTVNTTTNNIPNLNPYTQYDLRVRSVCGTTDMSIWKSVTFITNTTYPATIPYTCDFEDPTENAEWSFKNSGQTNKWYVGNASNNPDVNNTVGGANALYISNDGGDTWAYTAGTGNNSKSYAFRDFEIPAEATELRLTIDWIANGNGLADMLRVFWVSPGANINAGAIPPGAIDVDSALATSYGTHVNDIHLQGVTDWQETTTFYIKNTQFPNFAGKTWRLYFLWRNDVSSTTAQQPPAVVDNITLEAVTCPSPSQLLAPTATETSVTLNWTENGTATMWNVEYKKVTESTWSVTQAYNTPFVVDNLDHSSNYVFRVQADCGGDVSGYSNIVTKKTLCAPITDLPWDDSFESITTAGELPPCWLASGTSGKFSTQITNYGSYNRNARTGTRAAYFLYGCDNRLYTPGIQLQGGVSYDFSFWYVTDGYSGWTTLQSGVYTSQTSTTPTQVLATVSNANNTQYQMMTGTFVPASDGVYYFGVYCQATTSPWYLTVDDFAVYETPDCVMPDSLEASNVTYTSVDLEWTEEGDATEWEIEYGAPGFTSGTIVPAYTNPFTLTGLNHSTAYEIRVRSVCAVDDNSMWSSRVSIFTPCLASVLPFSEDFSTLPGCWTQTYSGGVSSGVWGYDPTGTEAGGTAGEMVAQWTNGVGVTRLISPLIRFDNVAAAELSFKHYYNNFDPGVILKVQCSPDQTTWTDLSFSHSGSDLGPTTETLQFVPIADSLFFAWMIDGDHFDINYWHIDDVSIEETSGCLTPIGISYSNVTTTSVDVEWVDPTTGNTWEIEYGALGFTQGTGTVLAVTTNPATITGLTSSTCYDFYVRAICGPGEESNWSQKQTFCTSQVPENTPFTIDFETESGFTFANNPTGNNWYIGSATGVNNTTGGSNGLYISNDNGTTNAYTSTSTAVWAFRDIYFTPSTDDYTLTFDWKCYGEGSGSYPYDYFNVYIGAPAMPVAGTSIVVPAGATALATALNQQTTWQQASYTLPVADYSGQTMRLYFCWRNDGSVANQPPAAIDNIAVSTAGGPVGCDTPTNLAISNISATGATATWGGTAASWVFEYKTAAATTWIVQNVTTPTYTMTGLQPSTAYEARVKAICEDGEESAYTAIAPFTTSATPCITPTNLQVTNVTDQSALATWTAGGNETSWQVDYKLLSSSNWTTGTATTTSFAMTGLQSNSQYHVRVKAICTTGESAFTEPVTFTTLGGTVTYTITATAGPHGTITPSGDVTVNQGASQTFTFTPEAGYRIDVVLVDGAPQVPVPESYTFENVQANHAIHVDFAESITENELSQYVTLYPNPTQSLIDLKLDRDYLGATECRIYDMYGKLMRIMPIEEEITTIDVSDFAAGVYFVRLTTEQGQVSKRFVKK
ncbi:MAG TPA: fibronectin type III domain-containing protein [Bacteroidales bacterium]|nr:fibronectin type III domain-containing protein [Bacteroidales bacterium]HQB75484.1 fibronectin type III domain-containing protein [Bacteroidales bacterium]